MLSVDGFFAGPKGELDWHLVDVEFNEYAIDMLNNADMLLFGRITYDLMASYWPTSAGLEDDPIVAGKMNSLAKIVFSKNMKKADWNQTKVLHEINEDEIRKMKEMPGKDILLLGSGTIVTAFAELELIDEYRLIISPIVLGKGKSLFAGLHKKLNFKLLKTKTMNSGNVVMYYQQA